MFKKGDIVRLDTGGAPIRVIQVRHFPPKGYYLYGEYVKSKRKINGYSNRFLQYEEALPQQKVQQKENTMTLYEVKAKGIDTVRYATYLATNGKGEWVMEEKGSGDIFTTAKEDAAEVMPYTFGMKFSGGGIIYHFLSKEGQVKVGDMLMRLDAGEYTGSVGLVTAVNTKSKTATKEFVGVRLLSEPV